MGPIVVADQMKFSSGIAARQRIKEFDELLVAMAPIATSVHLATGDLQRGEQTGGAVTLIVVGHLRREAGPQRQQRGGAIKRLNLRFFVHAQHQRAFARVEVKPHDIGQLGVKLRIGAELEVLHPVRLQPILLLDAMYGGGTKSHLLGQTPGAQMGHGLRRAHRRDYHGAGGCGVPRCPARDSAGATNRS
jgi:hypothetical protein